MKNIVSLVVLTLALACASVDADAARRFGGGGNLGRQRAVPTQNRAAPSPQPAAPSQATQPAQPSPAATPAGAPMARPTFMQRWGGVLAGLGIGAVLASLFGAQMGPLVGLLLMGLLALVVIGFVMRMLAGGSRRPAPAYGAPRVEPSYDAQGARPQYSGIGSRVAGAPASTGPWSNTSAVAANDPSVVLGGPVDPFIRVAKTSFIRLQAANDAGDLDDIRDYTTPEMFAQIAMQIRDRGGLPQKTEVVSVDAQVADAAIEGDYAYASVRFWGLIREAPDASPEPFDEIWHVRRRADNPNDPWVIAGIQQAA